MSNEYDNTGLQGNPENAARAGETPQQPTPEATQAATQPTPGAAPVTPQPTPEVTRPAGYPNVGSSGLNTANTAETAAAGGYRSATQYTQGTAYAQNTQGAASAQNAYQSAAQTGTAYTQRTAQNQYNPNAYRQYATGQNAQGGYTSSFGNSAYNGYSYTSAPQQPRKPKKKSSGGKFWLRAVACLGVAVIGFGSGVAGTIFASRSGLVGSPVVVQTVERNTDTAAISQGSADGVSLSLQDVSAIVQPSVVAITTEQMTSSNTWFGGSYVQSGAGSGVVISEDGYILTCAHVVSGATNISVQLSDDSEYTAAVVGGDSAADIAVIKIDAKGLTPAVIGDSDALVVGEDAIAVGNPLGSLGGTVTNGIISAVNRSVTIENTDMNLIQTNASISPGNSGGGLFNGNGELVGIVNAKSGYSEAEGLGFAIPINNAMEVAQALISDGYVKRPVLGITVITIADEQTAMQYGVSSYGVYIATVNSGSGAEAAGLKLGDRIVSVGDVAVSQSSDLTNALKDMAVGDTVTLQIERDGKLSSYDVKLGESSNQK